MTKGRKSEPAVPVGLEQVLLMAGLEPGFAEALRTDPEAALAVSGVALSTTERAILRTVPDEQIEQMAEQLAAAAQEPTRRAFMGHASAVVVALGGGAGLAAGCAEKKSGTGKAGPTHGGAGDMASMAMARQRSLKRSHRVVAPTGSRPGPWPHVTAGEPKIEGPMDPELVTRKLKAYSHAVKRCWVGKTPNPPLGTLRLDLTVDGKGKVSKASAGATTPKSKNIESCILEVVRQWRFSPSRPRSPHRRSTKIQVSYKLEYRY